MQIPLSYYVNIEAVAFTADFKFLLSCIFNAISQSKCFYTAIYFLIHIFKLPLTSQCCPDDCNDSKMCVFQERDITDVNLLKNNNFPYLTVSIKSDILGIDLICYGLILSEKNTR